MSPKADPWSNAVNENFFQKLKYELIRGKTYSSIKKAKEDLFWYIEIFYNKQRRHEYLGYISPEKYEQSHENVA